MTILTQRTIAALTVAVLLTTTGCITISPGANEPVLTQEDAIEITQQYTTARLNGDVDTQQKYLHSESVTNTKKTPTPNITTTSTEIASPSEYESLTNHELPEDSYWRTSNAVLVTVTLNNTNTGTEYERVHRLLRTQNDTWRIVTHHTK